MVDSQNAGRPWPSHSELKLGGCPHCGRQGCGAISCSRASELPESELAGGTPEGSPIDGPAQALKDSVRQLEKELQEAKATNCQLQFLFDRAVVAFIGTIMLNEFSIGADTEVMAQLFVEHEKFSELLPDDLAIQPWMEARFKEVVTRNTAA